MTKQYQFIIIIASDSIKWPTKQKSQNIFDVLNGTYLIVL